MFKLSELVTVVYKDENLQVKVEMVLWHIVWLLKEAQKPTEDVLHSKTKDLKKQRSSTNLAEKSDKYVLI